MLDGIEILVEVRAEVREKKIDLRLDFWVGVWMGGLARVSSNLKIVLLEKWKNITGKMRKLEANVFSKRTRECGFEGWDFARVFSLEPDIG